MERLTFPFKFSYNSLVGPSGPSFKSSDYPDLTGKKWLVTGVTGGIGIEISRILASLGAEMWLVGRNSARLAEIQKEFEKLGKGSPIHTLELDFTDLSTIRPAVDILKKQTSTLDGIIHNAGVMHPLPGTKTKQGIEPTVGVNNVAPQLLQSLLDPLIENNPHGRIVWTSSMLHVMAPHDGFDPSVVTKGSADQLYAMSKAVSYIQAVQWSLHHPNSKVKSLVVHPGIIKTSLTRTSPLGPRMTIKLLGTTPQIGALPTVYAALYPGIKNNEYVIPHGRPGLVRPDILRSARKDVGDSVSTWLNEKIAGF